MSAKTKFQPQVIDLSGKALEMPDQVYAGCWVRIRASAWTYDKESNGVNISLGNVLFVRDGEAFSGGGSDPTEDFADFTKDAPAATGGDDEGMFD